MTIDAKDIAQIVGVQLGCANVRFEHRLVEDLDATSVDVVNLTVAIEDRYQIVVREEDAATLRTVADLHALVTRLSGS